MVKNLSSVKLRREENDNSRQLNVPFACLLHSASHINTQSNTYTQYSQRPTAVPFNTYTLSDKQQ